MGAKLLANFEAVSDAILGPYKMQNRDFSPVRVHQPVFLDTVCFVNSHFLYAIAFSGGRRDDLDHQSRHNLKEMTPTDLGPFSPALARDKGGVRFKRVS